MTFVFMVFHWPEPGRRAELAASMRDMRAAMLEMSGCQHVEPPYQTENGECLVGLSRWESREAFESSGITLLPADQVPPGELRPRVRYLLDEVPTES